MQVFLLFLLDDHLGHEMMQFLVAVIDDELVETVDRQIFKSVNVQYAENAPLAVLLDLHFSIQQFNSFFK